MDGAALPALAALLGRLVETNRAAEELARRVLPAVRAVLKNYVRHVLPNEVSAARPKAVAAAAAAAAARGHFKGESGGGGGGGLHVSRRSGLAVTPRQPEARSASLQSMTLQTLGRGSGSMEGDGSDLDKEVATLIERIGAGAHAGEGHGARGSTDARRIRVESLRVAPCRRTRSSPAAARRPEFQQHEILAAARAARRCRCRSLCLLPPTRRHGGRGRGVRSPTPPRQATFCGTTAGRHGRRCARTSRTGACCGWHPRA